MKIFFSYPHDANAELVQRLKRDLEAKGHQVWFDESEIKTGNDWRDAITRGILNSDRAVAFLSKHATRDPGVCLNEIAIAQSEKGDALVTVLVEPEDEVKAPVSITHIQWLPMQDWQQRLARGPEEWEAWYGHALEKLVEVLENPIEVNRNKELNLLRELLVPLSFNAELARHIPHFSGRGWLFERYRQWLEQPRSKIFRVEGGPGMGKSAIAAKLAYEVKSTVIGIHFCKCDMGDSRDPRRLVQSLAYQMATRLPDYRVRLLHAPLLQDIHGKDAATLWNGLIVEPLYGQIERQRLSLVIDALDEATENGQNEIVKLLAAGIEMLPGWIGIVLTGRPDPEIRQRLQRYSSVTISGDDPLNQQDIAAWLDDWLADTDLTPTAREKAKTCLQEKSEGVFLYLRELHRQWLSDPKALDLTRPEALPSGLGGIYLSFFEHRFVDAQSPLWREQIRPLLELILACPEALPLVWAKDILAWDDYAQDDALHTLGSLFPKMRGFDGQGALAPFHKSVRDWLQDREAAGRWRVNPGLAREKLAQYLEKTLERLVPPAKTALGFAALLYPNRVSWQWLKELTAKRHPELDEGNWPDVRRRLEGLQLFTAADHPEYGRIHQLVADHQKKDEGMQAEVDALADKYLRKDMPSFNKLKDFRKHLLEAIDLCPISARTDISLKMQYLTDLKNSLIAAVYTMWDSTHTLSRSETPLSEAQILDILERQVFHCKNEQTEVGKLFEQYVALVILGIEKSLQEKLRWKLIRELGLDEFVISKAGRRGV